MAKRFRLWPFGGSNLSAPEERASAVLGLQVLAVGQARWTDVRYEPLARAQFERNAIVYRCARLVADALRSLRLYATVNGREVEDHPILATLRRPNPLSSGGDLLDAIACHLMIAGEAFVEGVTIDFDRRLGEAYALRPDYVGVVPSADGLVSAYTFRAAGGERTLPVPERGFSPVCHIRHFHPTDAYHGHSPLMAAARSVDENNEARALTTALMQRGGRGTGALRYVPRDGAAPVLAEDQRAAVLRKLDEEWTDRGKGRPMLLSSALEWVDMGQSVADLQAIDLRSTSAREVAFALGVPPLLLGLPGDNTFANYREANAAFYRQTVRPLAVKIAEALSHWLAPLAPGFEVRFDFDADAAAAYDRETLWDRAERATFLTVDERRALLGYEPLGGERGAAVVVSSSSASLDDVLAPADNPADALSPEEAARSAYGAG